MALCSVESTTYARERSEEAKDSFKYSHPCPSNGNNHGSYPGYVIDHVTALACGGADAPANMQWQSVAEGKAKDKWERKGCQFGSAMEHSYLGKNPFLVTGSSPASSNSAYFSGSRGGCFTYTASGNKRYVAIPFVGSNPSRFFSVDDSPFICSLIELKRGIVGHNF